VKINGETRYLWRAVDQEGEILESYITKTRDKAAALTFMKKTLKRHGAAEKIVTDLLRGDDRARQSRSPRGGAAPEQAGREFAFAISTTRAGDAAISPNEIAAEVRLGPRFAA
jgi:putative transposase